MTTTPNRRTPRSRRALLATVLATALAALPLAATVPPSASAFKVEDRGTSGLDGKVVMSPAAERIETVEPDGGEQVGPGSTIVRPVIIHNRTDAPVTFDMDVAQVVGSTADLVVEIRHGVHEGAAAWVALEKPSFTLQPGQQGTMLVTIKVPKDVKPGSKPFAVTATQRTGQVQNEGAGIAPQFKQVAIFIVELPGDAPVKGTLTKVSIASDQKRLDAARHGETPPTNSRVYVSPHWADKHRLTLSSQYENTGERLLRPSGKIVVKDLFGRVAGTWPIKEFTVYPGGSAAQSTPLKGLPSLGIFRATVQLESEAGGKQTTTLPRFVQVPKWFLLAVGAFLAFGAWRFVRWRLRRRREWRTYLEDEASGAGEDEAGADGDDDAFAASGDPADWSFEDDGTDVERV